MTSLTKGAKDVQLLKNAARLMSRAWSASVCTRQDGRDGEEGGGGSRGGILSGTYRRNRPRRVVVSKWTMHAYLFCQKLTNHYVEYVHKFPQISQMFTTCDMFTNYRKWSLKILMNSIELLNSRIFRLRIWISWNSHTITFWKRYENQRVLPENHEIIFKLYQKSKGVLKKFEFLSLERCKSVKIL